MATTSLESGELIATAHVGAWTPHSVSKQDWDDHRATFEQLYREENKTLEEVMAIMEQQYHFKATTNMYKKKVGQWGLDKKNKEHEIRAVVRKTAQRARVGKKSVFTTRGRILDPAEIERYLKRKSLPIASCQVRDAPTPPGLECFTPIEVPSSPRTPECFGVPEHIFILIRDYVPGSFQSGTWVCENLRSPCRSIKKCYAADVALYSLFEGVELACGLFNSAASEEGGKMLVAALASIKDILMAEAPGILIQLFTLVLKLESRRKFELVSRVLRQFSDMAAIVLPAGHPIGPICRHLASFDSHQLTNIVTLAYQTVVDRFESVLGQTNYSALNFRTSYITWQVNDPGQTESSLRLQYQRCVGEHGPYHNTSLSVLLSIVDCLVVQKRYIEAEHVALETVARASPSDTGLADFYYCESLIRLGKAQGGLGQVSLAEASFRRGIERSASMWGWGNVRALDFMSQLETYLVKWGRLTEAAKVRTQRREIIMSLNTYV